MLSLILETVVLILFIVLYCFGLFCLCVVFFWQVSCPNVVWLNYGPMKWYMYVCMYVCTYVCMYVCVYVTGYTISRLGLICIFIWLIIRKHSRPTQSLSPGLDHNIPSNCVDQESECMDMYLHDVHALSQHNHSQ